MSVTNRKIYEMMYMDRCQAVQTSFLDGAFLAAGGAPTIFLWGRAGFDLT